MLFDARPGSLDVDFFLHKNKLRRSDSGVVGVQVCRPNKTGTKLYSSEAFFSTTIMNFTAGVAVFFSALHHMWKAWCKQGKKSVGHGLMQRAPRLVGSSREKLEKSKTYSIFSFYFPGVRLPGSQEEGVSAGPRFEAAQRDQ